MLLFHKAPHLHLGHLECAISHVRLLKAAVHRMLRERLILVGRAPAGRARRQRGAEPQAKVAAAAHREVVTVHRLLRRPDVQLGIRYHRNGSRWGEDEMRDFARAVYRQHNRQTVADHRRLQATWANRTLLGEVRAWDLLQLLHFTIDHTDDLLMYTSQFIHCLQVYAGVSRAPFKGRDARWRRDMQIAGS